MKPFYLIDDSKLFLENIKKSQIVYSLDNWKKASKEYRLLDYDGCGVLATKTKFSNIVIYPSDYAKHELKPFLFLIKKYNFNQVVWFNRESKEWYDLG